MVLLVYSQSKASYLITIIKLIVHSVDLLIIRPLSTLLFSYYSILNLTF